MNTLSKIIIITLMMLTQTGFSQNDSFPARINLKPTTNKVTLKNARFASEITQSFWTFMTMKGPDYSKLEEIRRKMGYKIYEAQDNHNTVIDYISVEITTTEQGKAVTSMSDGNQLSAEQKQILNRADINTDIVIKIKFRYKYNLTGKNELVDTEVTVSVVPDKEAEFDGGNVGIMNHIVNYVIDKNNSKPVVNAIGYAVMKFTVDEKGAVTNISLHRSSGNKKADELLIEALRKMPSWKPAENNKGLKQRQTFMITMNNGC